MSVYGTGVVYGTGFVYGPLAIAFLDNGSQTLRGPIIGGTEVNVLGALPDVSCDDSFVGVVINPAKWTTAVVGSGSVVQNNGLRMRTGATPNSSAELASVPVFGSRQHLSVSFTIEGDVLQAPPAALTRFLDFELRVNATNFFRLSRVFDPAVTGGHAFRITCVLGGVTVDDVYIVHTATSGSLSLQRIDNRVIVFLNSSVVYDKTPFATAASTTAVFRAVNPSLVNGYDFTTRLNSFTVPALVLLGAEPAVVLRHDSSSLRLSTPAVLTPRRVSLRVYACVGNIADVLDAFLYEMTEQFKIVNQLDGSLTVGLLGDSTLRNLSNGRLGFQV